MLLRYLFILLIIIPIKAFALIEVDTGSFRSRGRDEVKYFEKEMGFNSFVEKVKYPIHGWLKLFHHLPILKKQANAIVSRFPLFGIKYHVFHEGTKRMIIESTVKCPKKVTLLAAHLALGKKTRAKQIKELIKIVNRKRNPVILMGDFNTFNGIKEINELMKKTHLKDKISLDKNSVPFTEPAWNPHRRLDYILTSPEINVTNYLSYILSLSITLLSHRPRNIDFELSFEEGILSVESKNNLYIAKYATGKLECNNKEFRVNFNS